jgi:hypothetical protein
VDGATATFGERPALAVLAVERDVQRAMVERVAHIAAVSTPVVRGKDAADKGDDGQAVATIVT